MDDQAELFDRAPLEQASAVPLRLGERGAEVCLITSTGRGRWIFPKGVVDPGETLVSTALKEAREEAGVEGEILQPALGEYRDFKWNMPLRVTVFAMSVSATCESWLEQALRRRQWTPVGEAHELLTDPTLRQMLTLAILRLGES